MPLTPEQASKVGVKFGAPAPELLPAEGIVASPPASSEAPSAMTPEQEYDSLGESAGSGPDAIDAEAAEYDSLGEPAYGTPVSQIKAFGEAAAGSLLTSAGTAAGTMVGGALGMLGGPAAPVTAPLGALTGMIGGFQAGELAREGLGLRHPEEFPPENRQFATAGEFFGGGLGMTGAIMGTARAGMRLAGTNIAQRFVNSMLDYTIKHPFRFLEAELGGLISGAALVGMMEQYFPGEDLPKAIAGTIGGALSPGRVISAGAQKAYGWGRRFISTMSDAGRETQAGQELRRILTEAGEDVDAFVALAKKSDLPGLQRTVAMKTDSPAMAGLEDYLVKESAKFGAERARMLETSRTAVRSMIVALRGTGDPDALRLAAEMEMGQIRALIEERVLGAQREAVEAAARITSDSPAAKADLSRQVDLVIRAALNDARDAETAAWGAVQPDIQMEGPNFLAAYKQARSEILEDEKLHPIVEAFVRRYFGGERLAGEVSGPDLEMVLGRALSPEEIGVAGPSGKQALTSGEMITLRSRLLDEARGMSSVGRRNDARIYSELAEAALRDLNAIPVVSGQLTLARTVSRELNDVFTRTFAGATQTTTGTGARRIPPELILDRMLGSGGTAADLKAQQLQTAARFSTDKGLETPEAAQNFQVLLNAQERILRLAAAKSMDDQGRINPKTLGRWIKENEAILGNFPPQLRADLRAAVSSEQKARNLAAWARGRSRISDAEAALAKVLKVDSAPAAIRNALASGGNAQSNMEQIVALAKKHGPQTVEGLRASIWEHAISRAGGRDALDYEKIAKTLVEPMAPGLPSLRDFMQKHGVMSKPELERLDLILGEAAKIERAVKSGEGMEDIIGEPSALADVVIRSIGAVGGGLAHKAITSIPGLKTGGASIVMAQAGSKYGRHVLEKVPKKSLTSILIEAAKDGNYAAALLAKPKTQAEQIKINARLHTYILQSGLTVLRPDEDQDVESQSPQ